MTITTEDGFDLVGWYVPSRNGAAVVIVHGRIETGWITGGGTYLDRYLLDDGEWRIARRRVARPFDLGPLPEWVQSDDLG